MNRRYILMERKLKYPFEAHSQEIEQNLDDFVDAVFSCLESEFLTLPKGSGFLEYAVFERGYEALKRSTDGFRRIDDKRVMATVGKDPISFIVLRTM